MKIKNIMAAILILGISNVAYSEGWCEFEYFTVISNGTKSNQVHLNGKLKDQENGTWMLISDAETGKANVAIALAAQMAGKKLSIYLDDTDDTCTNFPSWAPMGEMRHLRIL